MKSTTQNDDVNKDENQNIQKNNDNNQKQVEAQPADATAKKDEQVAGKADETAKNATGSKADDAAVKNDLSVDQKKQSADTNTLDVKQDDDSKKTATLDVSKQSKSNIDPAIFGTSLLKRSPRSNDEIHATLKFVNNDNSQLGDTVNLTGQNGDTIYEALGNKTVYDYILDQYPSYLRASKNDYYNNVNRIGKFINPEAEAEFNTWKKGSHPLFGYAPDADNDVDILSGMKRLEDGASYQVKLVSTTNSMGTWTYIMSNFVDASRKIIYAKYDPTTHRVLNEVADNPYTVKNGKEADVITDTGALPAGVYKSYNVNGEVPYEYIKRNCNPDGSPRRAAANSQQVITFGLEYPAETDADREGAEIKGKLQDWTTLDNLVSKIIWDNDNLKYYMTVDDPNPKNRVMDYNGNIGNPPDTTIVYYQNRPVEIRYVDVTDASHPVTIAGPTYASSTQASDDLSLTTNLDSITAAHNSEHNPDGKTDSESIPRTGKYEYYAYNSEGHLVKDSNVYTDNLAKLQAKNYVIVSTDVNDADKSNITYDKDNLSPLIYTVKVMHKAKKQSESKNATRTIHYVADSTSGKQLQEDTTQKVNLVTDGDYYVDATIADSTDFVHTKEVTDINGQTQLVVDGTKAADPIVVNWKIDTTKTDNTSDVTKDGNKFDFAKVTTPEEINVSSSWATTHDVAKGNWFQTGHQDNDKVTVDPNSDSWQDNLPDAYLIYTREATEQTETKQAQRTVHYVANEVGGATLKTEVTQNVTLKGTYYTDSDGNRVNVSQTTNSQGKTVYLVASGTPKETWVEETAGHDVTVATDGKGKSTFNKVTGDTEAPKSITIGSGANKGTWSLVDDSSNVDNTVDPTDSDWSTENTKQLDDVNLIYKRLAYNVYYRDVTDLVAGGKTSDFSSGDGTDLGHEITDINGALDEDPDKTGDLWKYTDAGYVLVSNPSGDALAKQTITKDVKDQYVYLVRTAKTETETKDVSRDVKYVGVVHDADDPANGTSLTPAAGATTKQEATLIGTYYVDGTKPDSTTKVNVKKVTINGSEYTIVDTTNTDTPEDTWAIDATKSHPGVSQTGNTISFDAVNSIPDTIGSGKTAWNHHSSLDKNDSVTIDPTSEQTYDPAYIVYKQKASYTIHYIDVNGVPAGASGYTPDEGTELSTIDDIGDGDDLTTSPDATAKVNTENAKYADKYVIVQQSDNLGMQELTTDVQDQYVYLKHAVQKITSTTTDVPKTPTGGTTVDPKTLDKKVTRTIRYRANTATGIELLDATTQEIDFTGSIYVDKVTGSTTTPETVKDVHGNDAQVATTTSGTITWKAVTKAGSKLDADDNASFDEVTKPVIDNGNLPGTWTTSDTAISDSVAAPSADPDDTSWKDSLPDVNLIYTKDVNATITYYDDTTGDVLITKADDQDDHGKVDEDIHFAKNPSQAIQELEDKGYVLVRNDYANHKKYVEGDDKNNLEIHFVHGAKEITSKTPTNEVPKPKDGTPAVDPADLTKTVTRTIHYRKTNETGEELQPKAVQTITYNGTVWVDTVTGKTTNHQQTTDADGATKDVVATGSHATAWTPVAGNGSTVSSDGKSISFDQVTEPTIIKDGVTWIVTEASKDNAPKKEVQNPDQAKWPEDSDVNLIYVSYHAGTPETETYTRTIEYRDKQTDQLIPNSDLLKGNTITQTVTLTRTPILDENNNIVGYGTAHEDGKFVEDDSWHPDTTSYGKFSEEDSPSLTDYGYKAPDKDKAAEVTVEHGKTAKNSKITIYYDHDLTSVTPDAHDKVPEDKQPGKPINPKGGKTYDVAPESLTKKVTRTIEYLDYDTEDSVNGSPESKHTYKQTLTFHLTAVVDKVTGKVIGYNHDGSTTVSEKDLDQAWAETPTKDFAAVDSKLAGSLTYTDKDGHVHPYHSVDLATVAQAAVGPDSGDITVKVHYKRNWPEIKAYQGTRTVTYKVYDENGNLIDSYNSPNVEHVIFDKSTYQDGTVEWGIDVDGDGKPDNQDTSFDYTAVDTPVKPGYYADKLKAGAHTVKASDANLNYNEVVEYHPLGHLIPVDEQGHHLIPDSQDQQYPNDPHDPTKWGEVSVPDIPGYTPTGGYNVGDKLLPTEPGKNTKIVYVKNGTKPDKQKYSLNIFYKTIDGTILKRVNDGNDHQDGSSYDESGKSLPEITINGTTYKLTNKKDPENVTGKFAGKNVTTIFYYEREYKTTVEYIDEVTNQKLIDDVDGQGKLADGDKFDNSDKLKDAILVNGKLYKLIADKSENVSGTIHGKDEVTIYRYVLVVNGDDKEPNPGTEPGGKGDKSTPSQPNDPGDTPKETPKKIPTETPTVEHHDKSKTPEAKHQDKQSSSKVEKQTIEQTSHKKRAIKHAKDYNENNRPSAEDTAKNSKKNHVENGLLHSGASQNASSAEHVNSPKSANVSTETKAAAKTLPQTGEQSDQAGIFGLALASLAGLFGLAGDRKKKRKK